MAWKIQKNQWLPGQSKSDSPQDPGFENIDAGQDRPPPDNTEGADQDSVPFFDHSQDIFRTDSKRTSLDSFEPSWLTPDDADDDAGPAFLHDEPGFQPNPSETGFFDRSKLQANLNGGSADKAEDFSFSYADDEHSNKSGNGFSPSAGPGSNGQSWGGAPPPRANEGASFATPQIGKTDPYAPAFVVAPSVNTPSPTEVPPRNPPAFGIGAPPDNPSPFRKQRDAVASALVGADDGGIPKVSPFIIDIPSSSTGGRQDIVAEHSLVLRVQNLSATFPIEKDITTIGRPDQDSDNYPDIEIGLDLDDSVSRQHARVIRRKSEYFIEDVGSTNGTILNGEKLLENHRVKLSHGDRIRVGERTEIIFE